MKTPIIVIFITSLMFIFSSCATFKSNIEGTYEQSAEKNFNADRVSVLFVFSHYRQTIGYDAIPRLDNNREIINGFDDFFLDALWEISNIKSYATYTNYSSDVRDTKQRAEKDSLLNTHDYIVKIRFMREKSFSKFFFSTIISSVTATVFPMRYQYKYLVEVNVYNSKQQLVKTYNREAVLNKWVQTFMIFAYPFHHEKRKKEELYVEIMHNIFMQMEADKILI